jgi:hypothetical protein
MNQRVFLLLFGFPIFSKIVLCSLNRECKGREVFETPNFILKKIKKNRWPGSSWEDDTIQGKGSEIFGTLILRQVFLKHL